jgi:hypothetical protein
MVADLIRNALDPRPVGIERRAGAGVPHRRLHRLDVSALGDQH